MGIPTQRANSINVLFQNLTFSICSTKRKSYREDCGCDCVDTAKCTSIVGRYILPILADICYSCRRHFSIYTDSFYWSGTSVWYHLHHHICKVRTILISCSLAKTVRQLWTYLSLNMRLYSPHGSSVVWGTSRCHNCYHKYNLIFTVILFDWSVSN